MLSYLIDVMIYAGSVLMAYNIYRYILFSRHIWERGNWDQERRLLNVPIVLLVLFLLGYLAVGMFGHPDLVIAAILFGGSIFVFVMLLLISRAADRIQENERLEAQLTAAEEASRAKTFFLSNMSHDIRTPLNAIIGYTTLAKRETATEEEKDGYILKIENAGHQLLDIVNDVLEMSRIESGRMHLEPEKMNLEDCVREAGDLVRTQMEEKGLTLDISCRTTHPWVLCDRSRLSRALMNLLCNAGKFTEENGQVSLVLSETGCEGTTGSYEIRVKDTGIGMSPEFVSQLFTPFERERTSTVSKIQGTGLGMPITRGIIDMMGGSIDVVTKQGEGTEFIVAVSFPLTSAPEAAEQTAPQIPEFDGVRILLAEDNAINLEIAKVILGEMGFVIETAENGQEAVDMITNAQPGYYAALLMDIQMPVMDGYTAARVIRALPDPEKAQIPIIAMTANAFREDIQAAEDAGMNGHIAKPLDLGEMTQTLRRALA